MAICCHSFSQVTVISNGNVGVGVDAPTQKLHVAGNSYFNGNIGVGVSSPSQKLHVVGNTFLNGNLGIGVLNPTYKLQVCGNVFFGENTSFLMTSWGLNIKQTIEYMYGGQYQSAVSYCDLYGYRNNHLRIGNSGSRANIIYTYALNYQTLVQNSDARLKENIKTCPSFLTKLADIKTYTYNYKNEYFNDFTDAQRQEAQRTEFGFLAQELQKIFPELVYEDDSTGILSINYVSMIPILTSAINELRQEKDIQQNIAEEQENGLQKEMEILKKEIEALKTALNACCKTNHAKSMEGDEGAEGSNDVQDFKLIEVDVDAMKLYQNAPNPFNESTAIQCYIPEMVKKAELCVYDMQGNRLQCLLVSERGTTSVRIQGGQLAAGVYTYLLIGDGKTSEAKQMILTK
ncbi:tail fiber domain-containing protein [Bacteroidales bacterium OttesenSCG-928-A14]|nr:tail fiber domain-containing protein [Bacteroidales bacterium OttesenSCG-928-A14]